MAEGTISLGTSGNMKGQIKWSSTSHGTTANKSTVTASIQVAKVSATQPTYGYWSGSLTVGGTTESFSVHESVLKSWVTIYAVSITKDHNSDGTGSCYISGRINGPSGTTLSGCSVYNDSTVTLDTIARRATITSAPEFNDTDNPTIKYSNPAGTSVTSIEACISLTGSNDDIAYRPIDPNGTSYTFELSEADRDILRSNTTEANYRNVRFFIRTVIGDSDFTSYVTRKFTVTDTMPTIEPTVTDVNEKTVALTGDNHIIVRYCSNVQVTIGAVAKKKAKIDDKSVNNGGNILTSDGIIKGAISGSFIFTATDNRKNTVSKTITRTVINYVKPTCAISNNKPNAEGEFTVKVTGNCFGGSFGAVDNEVNVSYRYKVYGGEFGEEWLPMDVTIIDDRYTATHLLTGLDYQSTYVIEAKVEDKLNTVYTEPKNVKASPIFDWGPDDFNLNASLGFNNAGTVLRHASDSGDVFISAPNATNGVVIRPNGTNSNSMQTVFKPDGSVRFPGSIYQDGKAVLTSANGYSLSGGTEILESEDLNNEKYRVIGNYYCRFDDTAKTLTNCPTNGRAFTMKVFHSLGTSYPAQRLVAWNTGIIYYRVYNSYSSEWYEWQNIAEVNLGDYVVSRGTIDIWTYEKWNSGKAVCWGKKNFGTIACTTAWGYVYSSSAISINLPDGLFNVNPQDVTVDLLYAGTYDSWINRGSVALSTSKIEGICIARAKSASCPNVTLGFHVIGTWK